MKLAGGTSVGLADLARLETSGLGMSRLVDMSPSAIEARLVILPARKQPEAVAGSIREPEIGHRGRCTRGVDRDVLYGSRCAV
jgi:hypothetical protein